MRAIPRLGAAALAVAALGAGAPAAGAAPPPSAPPSGCFWSIAINTTTANVAFPNGTLTNYWYTKLTLPAGAKLVLKGTYPRARYMSLNSYFSSPTDPALKGVATDAVYDAQIAPDAGSTNPFLPGARRTPSKRGRAWTLTVTGDQPPASASDRAPNTLYAGTRPAGEPQPVELLYRIYVQDKGTDLAGNGGLPEPTLVVQDGTTRTGQALCDAIGVETAPPQPPSFTVNQYLALTNLPPNPAAGFAGSTPQSPAANPPTWYRPLNPCMFQYPFFQSAGYPIPTCPQAPGLTQYPTKDNAYITAYVDRRFGPAPDGRNVVVMRGKLPTTPETSLGDPVVRGGKQLRYWGVCTNESLVTTRATVQDGCTYDEDLPTDRNGSYTIVMSTPEDRPSNAQKRCGVAWLNWGEGDGLPAPYTKPTSALLIVRNLIPDPSFAQAVQNVPAPGLPADVAATLGPYEPTLEYQSPAQFQRAGCSTKGHLERKFKRWLRSLR
ncbi:MAG: hypothetical protein ACEQSX_12785 [Baekduiaceae bacterium]